MLLQKLYVEVLTIAIDSTPRGKSNSIQDKKINCGQCKASTLSNPNTLLILQRYLPFHICTYLFRYQLDGKYQHDYFFRKCGVKQCGLGEVSTGHKKNLSHFHISKKFWKPWRKPANLPYFRLPAPIGQKFDMVSRTFLKF